MRSRTSFSNCQKYYFILSNHRTTVFFSKQGSLIFITLFLFFTFKISSALQARVIKVYMLKMLFAWQC